ncbi:MAG TPA: serine/threonine-protein kinase [Polyangiaceae bacterium]
MTDATTAIPVPVDFPTVGSLIANKFRLEQLIGEGGQAFIWRARHVELESEVALKILRTTASDPTQTERLRKEARAVVKLNHPSIVRVFDLGETPQGYPYFAMELLEGENLADFIERHGRMTPTDAVRLLLPIASAVAAVHAIGVVHRDLKPDNIFLARSAHAVSPKLLDFGVAKYEPHWQRPLRLTEIGAVLGSPAYLSPEQARGQADIDSRADVWSFCAMLYECVAGTVPFHAQNTHALLFSIAEDEPKTLSEHGVQEEELWQILHRGLSKSPLDRWPNMRALGRELAEWLSARGINSDVIGVVLESTWFNPELVTQPENPAPVRRETFGSDAPAWTKRSDVVESHVERRVAKAKPAHAIRYGALQRTIVIGALASIGTGLALAGSGSGRQLMGLLPTGQGTVANPRTRVASPWTHVVQPTFVKQCNNPTLASFPARPDQLLTDPLYSNLPAVPVEKLRLVTNALAAKSTVSKPNTHNAVLPAVIQLTSEQPPKPTPFLQLLGQEATKAKAGVATAPAGSPASPAAAAQ